MVKCKNLKLRAFARYMVYICTLLMCVLAVASYGPEPNWTRVKVPHQGSGKPRIYTEVWFFNGTIRFKRYPDYRQLELGSLGPGVYTNFELRGHQNPSSLRFLSGQILKPSDGSLGVRNVDIRIPTLLPTLVALVLSVILMVRSHRKQIQGCCSQCGYSLDGLAGGVCPECGEAYGEV
jgi:hypothetical protein